MTDLRVSFDGSLA